MYKPHCHFKKNFIASVKILKFFSLDGKKKRYRDRESGINSFDIRPSKLKSFQGLF